jgi:hypothetical protein
MAKNLPATGITGEGWKKVLGTCFNYLFRTEMGKVKGKRG